MKFNFIFKKNPPKTIILILGCWFVYSCISCIINIWDIPNWLQCVGLLINLMSISWLVMTFFEVKSLQCKIFNILLMLWFSPAWIYLDMTVFSHSRLVAAESFIIDSTMLLLLTLSNLFPSVEVASNKTKLNNVKFHSICDL
jgi:hypothetical protein